MDELAFGVVIAGGSRCNSTRGIYLTKSVLIRRGDGRRVLTVIEFPRNSLIKSIKSVLLSRNDFPKAIARSINPGTF